MNDLQNAVITTNGPCSIFFEIVSLYKNKEIKFSGSQKKQIEHGDYGYIILNGKKQERLFLKTDRMKIEAFCLKHEKEMMGADVNLNNNASHYIICGNIFS
jgi:hypothetical protein